MARRRYGSGRTAAAGIAVAGAVGLGLLALPGGAGAQPELPPVAPEDLLSSVLTSDPGPSSGTVEIVNGLGLPALPDVPQAADGTSTVRVWSDGDRARRVQIPNAQGERTIVADADEVWIWNSEDRTVVHKTRGADEQPPEAAATDPAAAARDAIARLRETSTVSVDGTAEVAGRDAYEMVLTPTPTERTLLREVRIAVDAEKRVPLRLTVLATGSADAALQIGFTDLAFGPQDAALFTFTPPPNATVEEAPARPADAPADRPEPTVVGDGWDKVVIAQRPADTTPDQPAEEGAPDLSTLGTPVSGPWGSGRLITTAVGSAIVTDDGRVAAGAVPEQVLTEALSR